MNNVLQEIKLFRDHTESRFDLIDAKFRAIESRLDRQGGLIQSGARALLRFDRWSDTADERIMQMADHIQSLEGRLTKAREPAVISPDSNA